MRETDLSYICQQMVKVIQGLRTLADVAEIRQGQAEKLYDLVREDLGGVRQDQRDLNEKLDCVIFVVQHDLEKLRLEAAASSRSADALTVAVQALQRPVAEIVAIRSRLAGLLLGLGVVGSVIMWLAEPVYRKIVEQQYFKH